MCVCVYLLRACAHLIPKSTVDRAHTVPHSRGATATEKCKNVAMCVCEREREQCTHRRGSGQDEEEEEEHTQDESTQALFCVAEVTSRYLVAKSLPNRTKALVS